MTEKADLQSVLDRAAEGGRITPEEALDLYRSAPLHALGAAADAVRRRRYAGTEHIATYIIERNINYTNVCVTACKFCAFYAAAQGHGQGLDPRPRRHPAPLRGDRRARRHPDHVPGRPPPGLRRRVLRGALRRDQEGVPAAGHPLPRRLRGRAHGPDLRGLRRGGHPAASTPPVSTPSRAPAPSCCPRGRARRSPRSRSPASAGWRSWRSRTGWASSPPPPC